MKKFLAAIFVFIAFSNCVYAKNVTKKEEYNKTINSTDSYIKNSKYSKEEISSDNILELIQKAYSYEQSGNYVMALRYYDRIIELDSENHPAYALRGLIYFEQYEAYTQALQDFTLALKYDSNQSTYYIYRALCRIKLGDNSGAISDLNNAIEINNKVGDKDAFVYFTRALLYYENKNHKNAIEDATAAIKIQPKYPDAFYCRGMAKIGIAIKNRSVSELELGIKDINYAKEQYLEKGDIDGYQKTVKSYNSYQKILKSLKN